jgi:hypothetical protein
LPFAKVTLDRNVSRDWSWSWLALVHIDDKPETAGITIIIFWRAVVVVYMLYSFKRKL